MGKGKGTGQTYTMTEQQLKTFARMAADEAVKKYTKEEKNAEKRKQDRRLFNMRILLENYRSLNEYANSAIYTVEQLMYSDELTEKEVEMLMKCGLREDDLLIKSVASGAVRVKTLMAQVNKMLNVYRNDCETSSSKIKQRQYRVINSMYLTDHRMTTKEIAEQEGEEIRTIQNDAKAAREDLTPLIFGIDGLLTKILKED